MQNAESALCTSRVSGVDAAGTKQLTPKSHLISQSARTPGYARYSKFMSTGLLARAEAVTQQVNMPGCNLSLHTGSWRWCPSKGEHPFMRLHNRCVTYTDFIYVTFSTFNVLNVFMAVQQKRQVNLII